MESIFEPLKVPASLLPENVMKAFGTTSTTPVASTPKPIDPFAPVDQYGFISPTQIVEQANKQSADAVAVVNQQRDALYAAMDQRQRAAEAEARDQERRRKEREDANNKAIELRMKDPVAQAQDAEQLVRTTLLNTPEYQQAKAEQRADMWDAWQKSEGERILGNIPEEHRASMRTTMAAIGAKEVKKAQDAETWDGFERLTGILPALEAELGAWGGRLMASAKDTESSAAVDAATRLTAGDFSSGVIPRQALDTAAIIDINDRLRAAGQPKLNTSSFGFRADQLPTFGTAKDNVVLTEGQRKALVDSYASSAMERSQSAQQSRKNAEQFRKDKAPAKYLDTLANAEHLNKKADGGFEGFYDAFTYNPIAATVQQAPTVATSGVAGLTALLTKSPVAVGAILRAGNTGSTVSDMGQTAYDNVMGADINSLKQSPEWSRILDIAGGDENKARTILASQASAGTVPLATVLGVAGGGFGAEHALTTVFKKAMLPTTLGAATLGIGKRIIAPGIGEGVEEAATQIGANVVSNQYGAGVAPTEGAHDAFAAGAMLGGLAGTPGAARAGYSTLRGGQTTGAETAPAAPVAQAPVVDYNAYANDVLTAVHSVDAVDKQAAFDAATNNPSYWVMPAEARASLEAAAKDMGVPSTAAYEPPKPTKDGANYLNTVATILGKGVTTDEYNTAMAPKVEAAVATGVIHPVTADLISYIANTSGIDSAVVQDKQLSAAALGILDVMTRVANTPHPQQWNAYAYKRDEYALPDDKKAALDSFVRSEFGVVPPAEQRRMDAQPQQGTVDGTDTDTTSGGGTTQQQSDATTSSQEPVAAAVETVGGVTAEAAPVDNVGPAQDDAGAVPSSTVGTPTPRAGRTIRRSNRSAVDQAPTVPPAAADSGTGSRRLTRAERPAADGSAGGTTQRTGGVRKTRAQAVSEAPYLAPEDVRVGDEFQTEPDLSARSKETPHRGTITKLTPKTVSYEVVYELTGQNMQLKAPRSALQRAMVSRDGVLYRTFNVEQNTTAPAQERIQQDAIQEQSTTGEMPVTQEAGQGGDVGLQQVGEGNQEPQVPAQASETQDQEVEPFETTTGEVGPVVRKAWDTDLTEAERDAVRAEHKALRAEYAGTDYEIQNLSDWTTSTTVGECFNPTRLTPSVPLWKRAIMKLADAVRSANKAIGAFLLSVALATGTVSTDADANPVVLGTTPVVSTISADANVVNAYVQQNKDNVGSNYIIADKKMGALYVMDATGAVVTETPALFGKTAGDVVATGQTAAGKFRLSLSQITEDPTNAYGGNAQKFTEGTDGSVYAIHRVITPKGQRRLQRLATSDPKDNRVSQGCINVPTEWYDKYLNRDFGGNIYIIPETASVQSMFPTSTVVVESAPATTPIVEPTSTVETTQAERAPTAAQPTYAQTGATRTYRPSTRAPLPTVPTITPTTKTQMVQELSSIISAVPDTAPVTPLSAGGMLLGAGTLRRRKKDKTPAVQEQITDAVLPTTSTEVDTTVADKLDAEREPVRADNLAAWDELLSAPTTNTATISQEADAFLQRLLKESTLPLEMKAAAVTTDPTMRRYKGGSKFENLYNKAIQQLGGGFVEVSKWLGEVGAPRIGAEVDSFAFQIGLRSRLMVTRNAHYTGEQFFTMPLMDTISKTAELLDVPILEARTDFGKYAMLRHITVEGYAHALKAFEVQITEQQDKVTAIEDQAGWQDDRQLRKAHDAATDKISTLQSKKAKLAAAIDTPGAPKTNVPGGITRPDAEAQMQALEAKYGKDVVVGMADNIARTYEQWVQYAYERGAYTAADMQKLRDIGFKHYVPLYGEKYVTDYMADTTVGEDESLYGTYAPEDILPSSSGVQSDVTRHVRGGAVTPAADAITNLLVFSDKISQKIGNTEAATAIQELYEPAELTDEWDGTSKVPGLVRVALGDPSIRTTYASTPFILARGQDTAGKTKWYRYYFENKAINEELDSANKRIQQNVVTRTLGGITRLYGRAYTYWTPVFNVTNAFKDWTTRGTDLPARALVSADGTRISSERIAVEYVKQSAIMHKNAQAAKALHYWMTTGKTDKSTYGVYIQEMLDQGALHTQLASLEYAKNGSFGNADPIQNILDAVATKSEAAFGKAYKAAEKAGGAYMHYLVEMPQMLNSMAAYVTMRELGVNRKEAANRTIDLFDATANSKLISAISPYMTFFRSRGQGAVNVLRTLRSDNKSAIFKRSVPGAAVLGARVLFHTMVTLPLASAIMGLGDDGEELIDTMSLSALSAGVPMRVGEDGSSIVAIPIGFGIDILAWKSAIALRRMYNGTMETTEGMASVMHATFHEVAPIDIAADEVWQANPMAALWTTFIPSMLRPATEVATNTNAFGQPIVRSPQAADKRASESGSDMTPEFYKDVAKALYGVAGVDARPEKIKHLIEGYMPGPLAFIKAITADKGAKTGGTKATEAEELGPIAMALGVGPIYNSGAYNSEAIYWGNVDKKNDILKRYNIDASDTANRGRPGRKEAAILQQLTVAGATQKELNLVSKTLDVEKARRKVSSDVRRSARTIWSNGQTASDNAPALQKLYEQDASIRDAYIKGLTHDNSDN